MSLSRLHRLAPGCGAGGGGDGAEGLVEVAQVELELHCHIWQSPTRPRSRRHALNLHREIDCEILPRLTPGRERITRTAFIIFEYGPVPLSAT